MGNSVQPFWVGSGIHSSAFLFHVIQQLVALCLELTKFAGCSPVHLWLFGVKGSRLPFVLLVLLLLELLQLQLTAMESFLDFSLRLFELHDIFNGDP